MKILHVYNNFYPTKGGVETYIEDVCLGLIKAGHRSDVCCLNRPHNSRKKLQSQELYRGINIYRFPYIDIRYYKIAPRIIKLAKKYDIIHIYGIGFLSDYLLSEKIFHGRPVVVSTIGGIFHTKNIGKIKELYFRLWIKIVLRKADRIIAISEHDKKLFSWMHEKLSLIPVPIKSEKFTFREKKKSNMKMLFIGRLSENKRIDRLLEVVKILSAKAPKTKLYLIGRDWNGMEIRMKKMVSDLGLTKNVEFLGEIPEDEMKRYIRKSTFFLSASEYESFGISAVEAMLSGMIVILNNIDSFRYFVKNGENGYIVDYSNPAEVAALILRLDKRSLSEISRKASLRASEFKTENVINALEKVYFEILDKK